MLDLCIDWKDVEVDFMGETVKAQIRPLSPKHMLLITPHLNFDKPKNPKKMTRKEVEEASKRSLELQEAAAPIFGDIVRNIEGVQVNGLKLDPALLGTEASLCSLANVLLSEALLATNLDKESEKNLPSPPAKKSPGQIAEQ